MTTITELSPQPTLFEEAVMATRRLTHEEAWERFLRRNPWFMPRVAQLAYDMRAMGRRPSTKAVFEIVRPEVAESGSPWKLDNSWSSLCADRLCSDYPDLERSIERRKRAVK